MRTPIRVVTFFCMLFSFAALQWADPTDPPEAGQTPAKEKKDRNAAVLTAFLDAMTAKADELGLTDPELAGEKEKEALARFEEWVASGRWIGRKVTWTAAYASHSKQGVRAVQTKLQPKLQAARKALASAERYSDFTQRHPHFRPAERAKRQKEAAAQLLKRRKELAELEQRITDAKNHPFLVRAAFKEKTEEDQDEDESDRELKIVAHVHKKDKPVLDKLTADAQVTLKGTIQSIVFKDATPVFEVELSRVRASMKE